MLGIALLVAVTIFYAGYNVLIKISGTYVPAVATTTILATISLQLAALLIEKTTAKLSEEDAEELVRPKRRASH